MSVPVGVATMVVVAVPSSLIGAVPPSVLIQACAVASPWPPLQIGTGLPGTFTGEQMAA